MRYPIKTFNNCLCVFVLRYRFTKSLTLLPQNKISAWWYSWVCKAKVKPIRNQGTDDNWGEKCPPRWWDEVWKPSMAELWIWKWESWCTALPKLTPSCSVSPSMTRHTYNDTNMIAIKSNLISHRLCVSSSVCLCVCAHAPCRSVFPHWDGEKGKQCLLTFSQLVKVFSKSF